MKPFFKTPAKREQYTLIAIDFVGITFTLFLSFLFQLHSRGTLETFFNQLAQLPAQPKVVAVINLSFLFFFFCLIFSLIYIIIYYISGLYSVEVFYNKKRIFIRLAVAVPLASLVIFTLLNIFFKNIFRSEVWLFHLCFLFVFLLVTKFHLLKNLNSKEPFRVVLIGHDSLMEKVNKFLAPKAENNLFSFYSISDDEYYDKEIVIDNPKKPNLIVYPFSKKLSEEQLISLVKKKFNGITVSNSLTFFKNMTGSFPVMNIDTNTLLSMTNTVALANQMQKRIQRIIDIFFSVIGIIVTLPVMLIIALLIKLTSRGPVFFIHDRYGIYQKEFRLYKFRTMVDKAEEKTGPVWAQKNDSRITPIGNVLRKTRLDEIPQFINVLKGDMSFIGPRPIRKFFADKLAKEFPYYNFRFYVKPGLTGWAQVSGDYGETVEGQLKKLEYDLFYIHEYSLLLDAVILLKTVQKVIFAKGQ